MRGCVRGCVLAAWLLVAAGCAVSQPIAELHGEQGGAALDVEMYRQEGQVKAEAEVRGGWVNMMTLSDPTGAQYRPATIKAKEPKERGPRFSVGFGGVLGGGRRHEVPYDEGHGAPEGEGGPGLGLGVSVPVKLGESPDDCKTFSFDVPEEEGPEYGGWQLTCEVTSKEGEKVRIPFEVPGTVERGEEGEGEEVPGEGILIYETGGTEGEEEWTCDCCPNVRVCVAVFILQEPDQPVARQLGPLENPQTRQQIERTVSMASRVWRKTCVVFQICGIYEIDPRRATLPGGDRTLANYSDGEGNYDAFRRINRQDFLDAAAAYADSQNLRCPLGNRACMKVFICNSLGHVGKYGTAVGVDRSQLIAPHPNALAHEFGHDLMGVVPERTDGSGHVNRPENVMNPTLERTGEGGLEPWQKERAQAEIRRRGLQVPVDEAEVRRRCHQLCEEIKRLTREIARDEAALQRAQAARPQPEPPAEGGRRDTGRGRRGRREQSLDEQIAEVRQQVEAHQRDVASAPDANYKRAYQRLLDSAQRRLADLEAQKRAQEGQEQPGEEAEGEAGAGGPPPTQEAIDQKRQRLEELKAEYRWLCCDECELKPM